MDKKTVQPKKKKEVSKKELTPNEKAQNFLNEYQALCEKHQMNLVITPAYKVSQDTGTWSTVLQTSVGQLQKNK